jgi:DNA-binding LacI/PurR family transcriptional regulator
VPTGGQPVVDPAAVVRHLAEQGHRDVARVSGPREFLHTRRRDVVWAEVTTATFGAPQPVLVSDYTSEGGLSRTRELLARAVRPTAVVYDNDVMAAAVVAERRTLGLTVPGELAVVAGEDSMLCRLASPAITALQRDVVADGARTARLLLDVLGGRPSTATVGEPRRLVVRASSLGTPAVTPRAGSSSARR